METPKKPGTEFPQTKEPVKTPIPKEHQQGDGKVVVSPDEKKSDVLAK